MLAARGLLPQLRVVQAIALRETRTRFGAHQLGYLWALVEPVLWILTFYGLFTVASEALEGRGSRATSEGAGSAPSGT